MIFCIIWISGYLIFSRDISIFNVLKNMGIKVGNLVNKKLIYVEKGTKAIDAIKLMFKNNIGSVLILDGTKLLGIFTERDLLKSVANGEDLNQPIENLATTKDLITIKFEDSLYKAAELMAKKYIRHLIVLDENDKPVGVISIRDIISEKHLLSVLSKVEEEFAGGD
jgi:predicted transcriptional regulator